MTKRFFIGLTGASGSIYGLRLAEALLADPTHEVHLCFTPAGARVAAEELDVRLSLAPANPRSFLDITPAQAERVVLHPHGDIGAGPASGTFQLEAMIVTPCSVKTLGALAAGLADNLVTRTGDVCLKEGRPLVLVVRETPFSQIHLENMLRLSRAGAVILPANPAFYHKPQTVEDLVRYVTQKTLDRLRVPMPEGAIRWGSE